MNSPQFLTSTNSRIHRRTLLWAMATLVLPCLGCGGCGSSVTNRSRQELTYQIGQDIDIDAALVVKAMHRRLPRKYGAVIQIIGPKTIRVVIPGLDGAMRQHVKKLIAAPGTFELRYLAMPSAPAGQADPADDQPAAEGTPENTKWIRFDPGEVELDEADTVLRTADNKHEVLVELDEWNISADDMAAVSPGFDPNGRPVISGSLTNDGADRMLQLTNVGAKSPKFRRLGIILDGRLISAPTVRSTIGERFQINGNFTQREVDTISIVLKAGPLPAKVTLVAEDTINVDK